MKTKRRIISNSMGKTYKNYKELSDAADMLNEKMGMPMFAVSFDYINKEMKIKSYFETFSIDSLGFDRMRNRFMSVKTRSIKNMIRSSKSSY